MTRSACITLNRVKTAIYWNDDGDLVIVFNKYDAAPGFMGTPEFTVKKSVLGDSLVPEYR